jgi:hypothetical protein
VTKMIFIKIVYRLRCRVHRKNRFLCALSSVHCELNTKKKVMKDLLRLSDRDMKYIFGVLHVENIIGKMMKKQAFIELFP